MSGLHEDEPIVLGDDDSQNMDNGENMPSTSGTQRRASNDLKEEKDDTCSDAESCEYVVEAIRAKRFNKETGVEEYLIKWVDYSDKDNTWEPIAHLKCETLLKQFEEKERLKELNKAKRRKTTGSSKPQSAKRPRRGTPSVDGSEATLEDQQDREKLFLESDTDEDEGSTHRSRKGRTHREAFIEPAGVKGFARGLPLETIINGVFGDDHKLFFFVKWAGEEALEMVSAEELKQNGAFELCNWYEKRLFWKNGVEPGSGDNPTEDS